MYMIPFFFFILLITLCLLAVLFAIAITLRIEITPLYLYISLFHIPIMRLKGKKLYVKLINLERKNRNKSRLSKEYLSLLSFIHLDFLSIRQSVDKRNDLLAILCGINDLLYYAIPNKKIKFSVDNNEWNTCFKIKVHFYLGTLILNYLLIRRSIHNGK